MPSVQASTVIRAPLERVYALAQDVERFPEYMPDLERVTVLERQDRRTVTQWVGVVQGRRIRWVEEDEWDDARWTCTFRQRSGDFARYEGQWRFEPTPEGTRTSLVVEYDLEIPLAGPLLGALVKVLMRKNCESMLAALKAQAEGPA
ncbi:MAG: SRPBCC family protein [Armatimonadota bacterium]|nr:SRPBCC family protein [Armatimonadota bacterium]MDR7518664.1 SRPBCC family protein [Armatimonadota bacterium]MDR7549855.1 SRPBCC family protein [Armatimonadota bacterium]